MGDGGGGNLFYSPPPPLRPLKAAFLVFKSSELIIRETIIDLQRRDSGCTDELQLPHFH